MSHNAAYGGISISVTLKVDLSILKTFPTTLLFICVSSYLLALFSWLSMHNALKTHT